MAEERRLCYVGITRTRRRLFFSLARTRSLYGNFQINEPSRFLKDIPPELFDLSPRARPAQRTNAAQAARPGAGHYGSPRRVPPALRSALSGSALPTEAEDDLSFSQRPPPETDVFIPDDTDFDQRSDYERRAALKVSGQSLPGPGDSVFHGSFGQGVVVSKNKPLGPNAVLVVRFPGLGDKKILARFLKRI